MGVMLRILLLATCASISGCNYLGNALFAERFPDSVSPYIFNATRKPVSIEFDSRYRSDREVIHISLAAGAAFDHARIFMERAAPSSGPRAVATLGESRCEIVFAENADRFELVETGDGLIARPLGEGGAP